MFADVQNCQAQIQLAFNDKISWQELAKALIESTQNVRSMKQLIEILVQELQKSHEKQKIKDSSTEVENDPLKIEPKKELIDNTETEVHLNNKEISKSSNGKTKRCPNLNCPHEKTFECNICARVFKNSTLMKNHQRIHSGLKPYECRFCPKHLNHLEDLKIHERIHTGERPFQCTVCEKKFITNSQLKNHHRIHTGEKPYKCDLCEAKFRDSTLL